MTFQENPSRDSRNRDQKVRCHSLFTNCNQIYNFKAHAPGVGGFKYNGSLSNDSRVTEHYSYKAPFIIGRLQNYFVCSAWGLVLGMEFQEYNSKGNRVTAGKVHFSPIKRSYILKDRKKMYTVYGACPEVLYVWISGKSNGTWSTRQKVPFSPQEKAFIVDRTQQNVHRS